MGLVTDVTGMKIIQVAVVVMMILSMMMMELEQEAPPMIIAASANMDLHDLRRNEQTEKAFNQGRCRTLFINFFLWSKSFMYVIGRTIRKD